MSLKDAIRVHSPFHRELRISWPFYLSSGTEHNAGRRNRNPVPLTRSEICAIFAKELNHLEM